MNNPARHDFDQRPRQSGSALLLVIWAVMLMSVAVMGVVEFMGYSVDESVEQAKNFRAMHLAESGVALGLHPQLKAGDSALMQQVEGDSGFQVRISSEGAGMPLDYLDDTVIREAVYNLFVYWGLSASDANVAADSLADWKDADNDARSQGAETEYYESRGYEGFPRQQAFTSLEELLLVRGMDKVEKLRPDWRTFFNVHGDGMIDLNTASRDILIAVCGASESNADNLIRERNGGDGLPNTQDDVILTMDKARTLLNMDEAKYTSLTSYLTVNHSIRRVESTGRVGESTFKVVVVASIQTDGSLNYLARYEEK